MRNILLVARREYRQVASRRGFVITLLALPLCFAISILASRFIHPPENNAYAIVDANGAYAAAVERRIELNYQRQVLSALSAYVEKWKLASADPAAPWARPQGWYGDAETEAFVAKGGLPAALREIAPRLPAEAPKFEAPTRKLVRIDLPAGVPTDAGPDHLGAALGPYLKGDVATPAGKRPLALVVYIPKGFGAPGASARMWTNGSDHAALIETVRAELTRALRLKALQAGGFSEAGAAQVDGLSAPITVAQAPVGDRRDQVVIRSAVPLALVYLLLITTITTGSMMLQGVIEERSNKLLEAVLACVKPAELMYGKLLGLGAIGLTIVLVWGGCAVGAGLAFKDFAADVLVPSMRSLDQPWMIAALLFYFLSGYLIVSMAFLTIGSVSNSMQDAQAFLMPVMMALMLPVVLMMNSALLNPGGPLPRVMSWIPVYTPFAMLARLNGGISVAEVAATGVLLVAFVALEFVMLGRVFRSNLLNAGQPPKLAGLFRLMIQRQEA
jgi:ABC-2 type transport system permease protein